MMRVLVDEMSDICEYMFNFVNVSMFRGCLLPLPSPSEFPGQRLEHIRKEVLR